MSAAELLTSLTKELQQALEKVRLPSEYMKKASTPRKVRLFSQYLPPNLFEEQDYYPAVTVEFAGMEDDLKTGSLIHIALSLGVFALEEDAWRDALHLMEVLRNHLLTRRLIGKKFRLTDKVTWSLPATQPAPFFFILTDLTYESFLSQENIYDEYNIHRGESVQGRSAPQ